MEIPGIKERYYPHRQKYLY